MRFPLLFSSFSFGGEDGALGFELLLLLLGNEVMDIINGAKIKQNHGGRRGTYVTSPNGG